jgi:hypothetical protein
MALGLSPWTIRNYLLFHEIIPVSDEAGASFFDGNSRWANVLYDVKDRKDLEPLIIAMDVDRQQRLARLAPEIQASRTRRSLAQIEMALDDRRADPAGTVLLFRRKLWHWIRPYPTLFWGKPIVFGMGALYAALYAFASIGLVRADRRGVVWFAGAVLVISMALHVALLVLWRYRIPYADPILLLWGLFSASSTLSPLWTQRS